MTEKILIPGPVIFGKQRDGFIIVKRNRVTSSVRWDIGGIDICGPASDAISHRCEASGMMDEIRNWWSSGKPKPGWGSWGCRWGHFNRVPNDNNNVDDLVAIIKKHWEPAFVNLPLHYDASPSLGVTTEP